MKILLIRFSSLGDCILLCPLCAAMKAAGAERVAVVTKRAYASVFEATEGVDEVIAFDPSQGIGGLMKIAGPFRNAGYTVIDAHNNTRSRLLSARLGGAVARFEKHYRERLGMIVFKKRPTIPTILEGYARLAQTAGLDIAPLSPGGLAVPDLARARAAEQMPAPPWVGMAPGSRWPDKCWPPGRYAALAQRLVAETGMRVALFGDEHERDAASVVAAAVPHHNINLTGQLGLIDTAAHLKRCSALVGNDSGLAHLAEACGVPVVTLFGPTVRAFGYAPSLERSNLVETELSCRPCSRNGSTPCIRGDRACMTGIEVTQVFDALAPIVLDSGSAEGRRDA